MRPHNDRVDERLISGLVASYANQEEMAALAEEVKREAEASGDLALTGPDPRATFLEPAPVNPAARELASRNLARRRLLPFVMRMREDYKPGWVHRRIALALEKFSDDVMAERSPRLMISMPPRHGKSLLASQLFPSWHLGRAPTHEVIAAAYALSLPMEFSRTVRDMLREPDYQRLFETRLSPDSQNVEAWKTTKGGGYRAAGVGGPLTGHGCHIGIIDDPVKNWEEAQSDTILESIWRWYTSTFYSRLAPGAGVLVIQTRWNDRDLSGRLRAVMDDGSGDQWEILEFEALASKDEAFRPKGEALHPERYDRKFLLQIQKQDPIVFETLYQQRPTSESGGYFKPEMFRLYDDLPPGKELRWYATWDLAITANERSNYSVGIAFAVDTKGDIYVADLVRERMEAYDLVEAIIDQYFRRSPEVTVMERGHIQLALGPYLDTRITERKAYGLNLVDIPPGRKDKEARARSIQGLMRQGRVFFPKDAPWLEHFRLEMLSFPNGKFDDVVDAMAYIGLKITDLDPTQAKEEETPQQRLAREAKMRYSGVAGGPRTFAARLQALKNGLGGDIKNPMVA